MSYFFQHIYQQPAAKTTQHNTFPRECLQLHASLHTEFLATIQNSLAEIQLIAAYSGTKRFADV